MLAAFCRVLTFIGYFNMNYKEYKPDPQIAQLVECFWSNSLDENDFNHQHDIIIPDGSAEIIFMLKGNYLRVDEKRGNRFLVENCSLVTPFKRSVNVYQKPSTQCLVIRLKSGALQQLAGCSLGELDKEAYPLEEVMPDFAEQIMELVLKDCAIDKLIGKITRLLVGMPFETTQNHLVSRYIAETVKTQGAVSVMNFCSKLNIHKSTLEKSFKKDTGLNPKEYARIIRFNYLLNRLLFTKKTLVDLSLDLGFYDQSHMTREFKSFVGLSPVDFLKQKFSIPMLAAMGIANKSSHYC